MKYIIPLLLISICPRTQAIDQTSVLDLYPSKINEKQINDTLIIDYKVPILYDTISAYEKERKLEGQWEEKEIKTIIRNQSDKTAQITLETRGLKEYLISFKGRFGSHCLYSNGGSIKEYDILSYRHDYKLPVVLVLVDESIVNELKLELSRYKTDLISEGYNVIIKSSPFISKWNEPNYRSDINNNKKIIKSYNIDYCVIVGNISVPYSGFQAPDGHLNHMGAWPMDYYYFSDQIWTDGIQMIDFRDTNGTYPYGRNRNVPNDGKFDYSQQDNISFYSLSPLPIRTAYGRIIFDDVATGKAIDHYKNYFRRNHEFRNGKYNLEVLASTYDDFAAKGIGYNFNRHMSNNLPTPDIIFEPSLSSWRHNLTTKSSMFTYAAGSGDYTNSAIGSSNDNYAFPSQGFFNFIFGSYFGDWDNSDNYLKSFNYSKGLATSWIGWGNLRFHNMMVGETIGQTILKYQNNYYYDADPQSVSIPIGNRPNVLTSDPLNRTKPINQLLGDPTLSSVMQESPNVECVFREAGDWIIGDVSVERDPFTLHAIYISYSADGPFQFFSSGWVSGYRLSWFKPAGNFYYMIKKIYKSNNNGVDYYKHSKTVILKP